MTALINRILPSSCVDGPGNRMAVFFQGCNFRCLYCHNPETIGRCTHCGLCVSTCPTSALALEQGHIHWEEKKCTDCGACYAICPQSASPKARQMTVGEVAALMEQHGPFIRGITTSGGECTLQREFLVALFQRAKALGLSTLADTNGGVPLAKDEELMACCDGIMLDVKSAKAAHHRQLTGCDSGEVLQNAVSLARMGKLVEVRTVILPDNPHNADTVSEVSRLLKPYTAVHPITYKLIRFRPLGVRGEAAVWPAPGNEEMERMAQLAAEGGFSRVVVV